MLIAFPVATSRIEVIKSLHTFSISRFTNDADNKDIVSKNVPYDDDDKTINTASFKVTKVKEDKQQKISGDPSIKVDFCRRSPE